jgi:N-formylglutamate amidohydrolase
MDDCGFDGAPFAVAAPPEQTVAMVVASPHSGSHYPEDMIQASALDRTALRQSEDCFIDEVFGDAPAAGAPLLRALVARAYIDCNREAWELDPGMFEESMPSWVNCRSLRVSAGLGTIARIVADGQPIYRRKLRFADAVRRVERFYKPYHAMLEDLIAGTVARFGFAVLIDGHSMPSPEVIGGARRRRDIDFVLGDRLGTSCHPLVIDTVEAALKAKGYRVVRNVPYAGGHTTCHYGRPDLGRHCLQIEINRALYMDERRYLKKPGFETIRADLGAVLADLARVIRARSLAL